MWNIIEVCDQHEDIREKFRSKLFFAIGSNEYSFKVFLEVKVDDLPGMQSNLRIYFKHKTIQNSIIIYQQPNLTHMSNKYIWEFLLRKYIYKILKRSNYQWYFGQMAANNNIQQQICISPVSV